MWVIIGLMAFLAAVAGLVSCILPLRPIGIKTRTQGFITAGVASAVFLLAASQLPAELEKYEKAGASETSPSTESVAPTEDKAAEEDTGTPGPGGFTTPDDPPKSSSKRNLNSIASRNMHDVLKGLKAGNLKHKAYDGGPCINDNFCAVRVGRTNIESYGGGAVNVTKDSKVPTASYVLVCAAVLSGLAEIDPLSAASFVGEGFARGRVEVGDVTLKAETRQNGDPSCGFYRKRR